MAEGNSVQELVPEISTRTPDVKPSQETKKPNIFKHLNSRTAEMAFGTLGPNELKKTMTLLNNNTALLTEMANSQDLGSFETAVETTGNFLKFYDNQNQDTKVFLQTSDRYGIKDFANFSTSLLSSNMEQIEEEIKSDSVEWESKSKLISAVVNLARVGEGIDREKAVECLVSNIDILSKDALEAKISLNDLSLRDILDTALECGNPAQVETLKQWAIKIATENRGNLLKKLPPYNMGLIKWLADVSKIEESSIQKSVVSAFGINAEEAMEAWKQAPYYGLAMPLPSFDRNLTALYEIESNRPGIGKVLQEEFGINDFARYPKELLIAQYDKKDTQDNLPYGVIIYPKVDYNGALYQNLPQFEDVFSQLQGKYKIAVWEVKNLLEIVSALNKSRHRYGPISFAIIGGHGAPENIRFGKKDTRRSEVGKTDLERSGANSLRLAFVDNPSIILASCSTGQLGGIGQEISKIGANVISPTADTNLDSINVSISDDGRLNFDVKYKLNVSENTYSLGKKVEK